MFIQFSLQQKLNTNLVADEDLVDVHEGMSCPVCLDVYYNAYSCHPCKHTFCEPCLRRLAKYMQDAGKIATCPICRITIDYCLRDCGKHCF